LRKASLAGTTVHIKLRWPDFSTITRQKTLSSPSNLDQEIFDTAKHCSKFTGPPGKPVRLIGVGVSNLSSPVHQLSLWDDDHEKHHKLITAVDELRERYGKDIITRAYRIEKSSSRKRSLIRIKFRRICKLCLIEIESWKI
jgi:DNA polymerase IV